MEKQENTKDNNLLIKYEKILRLINPERFVQHHNLLDQSSQKF
jgi:hypothetical protein